MDKRLTLILTSLGVALALLVVFTALKSQNPTLSVSAQKLSTKIKGFLNLEVSYVTIPNNPDGFGSATINPQTSFVKIECQDPEGCQVDIDPTSGHEGDFLLVFDSLTHTGTNTYNYLITLGPFPTTYSDFEGSVQPKPFIELIHDGTDWRVVDKSIGI